uniref:DSHCT domain-containing protein n=1 Tax=Strongyloides venezuelensis TaxID=75913 RepID=A0A0K0FRE1_STRVS
MCGVLNYKEFLKNFFRNFQKKPLNMMLRFSKKAILKNLNFINTNDELTEKGAIAASISHNPGALIIGKLIKNDSMVNMTIDQSAAILSLFVCPKSTSKKLCQKTSMAIRVAMDILKKINEDEKNMDISNKQMLKVDFCSLMFRKVQDVVREKSISEVIDKSEVYAAILLKTMKDIKKLAEKMINTLNSKYKNHFKHLIDVIAESIKEDVTLSD